MKNNNTGLTALGLIVLLIVTVLYALASGGCGDYATEKGTKVIKEMKYVQDPRTKMCFAIYVNGGNDESGLTWVPCKLAKKHIKGYKDRDDNDKDE